MVAIVSWLCVGLALCSLGPSGLRGGGLQDFSVAGVSTGLVAFGWYSIDSTVWWPAAIAVGCAAHIVGALLTSGGVRLLWPLGHHQALPLIRRTDSPVEHLTGVALLAAVGWLGLAVAQ